MTEVSSEEDVRLPAPLWIIKLRSQTPLTDDERIPYIAMPLENIDDYVRSPDFSANCVKSIVTIGILREINSRMALLTAVPGSPKNKLRLAIDHLNPKCFYAPTRCTEESVFRHSYRAVKIYGTLEYRNKKIVLIVYSYDLVQDIESAVKILKTQSKFARRHISMYFR